MTDLPRIDPAVVVEPFPDGAVAFDPRSARAALLDQAATALLLWLDGTADRTTLEAELADGGVAEPSEWLTNALAALRSAGLLCDEEGTV